MPTSQMSKAIYALQRKLISVEESVNVTLVDHAGHIDTSRVFGAASSKQSAFAMVSPQFSRVCGADNKAKFRLSARMACTREVG